jgi:hypothetical protein
MYNAFLKWENPENGFCYWSSDILACRLRLEPRTTHIWNANNLTVLYLFLRYQSRNSNVATHQYTILRGHRKNVTDPH